MMATCRQFASGANGDRTHDLLLAKQALSHLSYGPRRFESSGARLVCDEGHAAIATWATGVTQTLCAHWERPRLLVEIEVSRRLLLEPETIVLGRLL
jgi:hypothetical protein